MTYAFVSSALACAYVPARNGTVSFQLNGLLRRQAEKVWFVGLFCLSWSGGPR